MPPSHTFPPAAGGCHALTHPGLGAGAHGWQCRGGTSSLPVPRPLLSACLPVWGCRPRRPRGKMRHHLSFPGYLKNMATLEWSAQQSVTGPLLQAWRLAVLQMQSWCPPCLHRYHALSTQSVPSLPGLSLGTELNQLRQRNGISRLFPCSPTPVPNPQTQPHWPPIWESPCRQWKGCPSWTINSLEWETKATEIYLPNFNPKGNPVSFTRDQRSLHETAPTYHSCTSLIRGTKWWAHHCQRVFNATGKICTSWHPPMGLRTYKLDICPRIQRLSGTKIGSWAQYMDIVIEQASGPIEETGLRGPTNKPTRSSAGLSTTDEMRQCYGWDIFRSITPWKLFLDCGHYCPMSLWRKG